MRPDQKRDRGGEERREGGNACRLTPGFCRTAYSRFPSPLSPPPFISLSSQLPRGQTAKSAQTETLAAETFARLLRTFHHMILSAHMTKKKKEFTHVNNVNRWVHISPKRWLYCVYQRFSVARNYSVQ